MRTTITFINAEPLSMEGMPSFVVEGETTPYVNIIDAEGSILTADIPLDVVRTIITEVIR